MSEGADPESTQPSRWIALRRRATELFIVFFGVYAAFLLNRFDTYRRDETRRTQILAALEREIASNLDELQANATQAEADISRFDHALAAGDMPPVGIFFSSSGYSATDDATLLQVGGLELLDMQTVELLRQVNTMQRSLMDTTHNQFELSLAELTNHASADFYDPATRQLKPAYRWYPVVLHNLFANLKELTAAEDRLLTHLRAISHPGAATARPSPAPSSAAPTTPSGSPAASKPGA